MTPSEKIAIDMLMTDMRIIDARIETASEYALGIRQMHERAVDNLRTLRAVKSDIQARFDGIAKRGDERP